MLLLLCCFQSIKVKKFESNSQLPLHFTLKEIAVFRVSKLKSLKAIHNYWRLYISVRGAVFRVSKLKSLKAIHNSSHRCNRR